MTEETDERDGPAQSGPTRARRIADWLDRAQDDLMELVDKTMAQMRDLTAKKDDVTDLDRRARTIGNLARAVKLVGALEAARHIPEDEMSDDSDSEDPAEIQRLRAELESRFQHLRGVYERKRRDAGLDPDGPSPGFGLGPPAAC